jgi:hypothetical protein
MIFFGHAGGLVEVIHMLAVVRLFDVCAAVWGLWLGITVVCIARYETGTDFLWVRHCLAHGWPVPVRRANAHHAGPLLTQCPCLPVLSVLCLQSCKRGDQFLQG